MFVINYSGTPDKHRGDDAEAAADRFKDIATAYSILRCGRAGGCAKGTVLLGYTDLPSFTNL